MLKAGALYYAILVAFLVALLTGFLMVNMRYHHRHTILLGQNQKLERNVRSALRLALETPDQWKTDQTSQLDLYGEDEDEVAISKKQWGGFFIFRAEASWRNQQYSAIELAGADIFTDEPVALYLADKERYLSVSGNTFLNGNCYLPKLGIRRAYIEGVSFMGDELVHGKVETSKASLPEIEPSFTETNRAYFTGNNFPNDSVLAMTLLMKQDSIENSFSNKTIVFYTDQWIKLTNKRLKGNIRIISSKGITLGNKTQINDILVYAPKIELEQGFAGSVQLFARDTLLVHEGTRLLFPSLIAMLDAAMKKPLIHIEKQCSLSGDIVCLKASGKTDVQPECIIDAGSEIDGRIYCDGKLHLKGVVHGSVYCNGFILQTPSSLYENHLLNATIDFKSLSPYYSGSGFFKVFDRYKAVKWLN